MPAYTTLTKTKGKKIQPTFNSRQNYTIRSTIYPLAIILYYIPVTLKNF